MPKIITNSGTSESTIYIGRATISRFVNLVEDRNPIHTNRKIAEYHGFKDTPIPGTMLHAYFEQLTLDSGFNPLNYSLKFANPAYPDESLTFRKTLEGDSELELACLNGEGAVVASCSSKLSNSIGEKGNWTHIGSYDHEISEKRKDSFCSLLGIDYNGRIPISLVSSSIPSSLLKFLFEKTGNYEGAYRRIDFNLHATPEFGDLNTNLHFKRMKPIGDNFIYDIAGECFQEGKRVLSASVKVITSLDIEIS